MNSNKRIAALRQEMKKKEIDAFLIPSSDPHQSEYVAPHWQSRKWISGFTGSAGIAVITGNHAGLWTDSRYFLQAEDELADNEMLLQKQKVSHAPEHLNWLKENLPSGSVVGCDGMMFSINQIRHLEKSFDEKDIALDYNQDLISLIWQDRPVLPDNVIFEHEVKYTGKSRKDKLGDIRRIMKQKNADYHLITTLDDIAWTFNIRSNDVECNPVTIAYAIISLQQAFLFIDSAKVPDYLWVRLEKEDIQILPYAGILTFLQSLSETETILVDPAKTSIISFNAIRNAQVIFHSTISTSLKAIKNDTEISHVKNVMRKDAIALTKLFRWLEKTLLERAIPETEIAEKLNAFRSKQDLYHGESFAAIVGYNSNGAIVHYHALPDKCAMIKNEGILLLDSGGQYTDGTTDITRTIAIGVPTAEQKQNFTLVLKGHIDLAMLKFPYGTRGNQMEMLARQPLWKNGLNYSHGTGHGVGFFLNVHEGPQALGTGTTAKAAAVFEPGMLTSNEPGFYKTGEYGIRIENLIFVVEDQKTDFGTFLKFETVTLFPIDLNLIDLSLLDDDEIIWLNDYHQRVYDEVSPLLNDDEKLWLKEKCRTV
jgi:Xaa-Pro aminopeptidase